MHPEAMEWIARYATDLPLSVLDIGGRYINGSPRSLFPAADYTVLDILPGANVNVVADAATWEPTVEYDAVLLAEMFEHTEAWPDICRTAFKAARPGGFLVATCAGPGRVVHSGVDGGPTLHPGEWYRNVEPDHLRRILRDCGWRQIKVDQHGLDVRAHAIKPPITEETTPDG
jgi:hypothetical protein